jgi:hypothetical protein
VCAALAGLVAASREEDRFGVVQRSDGVRRTLHSLLALDLALEAYCALPLPLPKPPASTTLTSQGVTRPHPHAITAGTRSLLPSFFFLLLTRRQPWRTECIRW